jgi:hypothetical protein
MSQETIIIPDVVSDCCEAEVHEIREVDEEKHTTTREVICEKCGKKCAYHEDILS